MPQYYAADSRRRRVNQVTYGASSNRTTLGYWVPLALTVTAATVGLAAWIWSERKEEHEESSGDEQYRASGRPPGSTNMSGAIPPGGPPGGFQGPPTGEYQAQGTGPPPTQGGPPAGPPQPEWGSSSRSVGAQSTGVQQTEDTGLVARMSSALGMGRSASPSKAYDWASRNITAGVAAAAATVGGALGYAEGSKEQYEDHRRWSEEADSGRRLKRQGTADEFYSGAVQLPRAISIDNKKRKTVALVVSSVQSGPSDEDLGSHASLLSSIPEFVDHTTTRIFVLIYAPTLTTHPASPAALHNTNPQSQSNNTPSRRLSQSRNSSFSNIGTDEAHTPAATPGEFPNNGDGILSSLEPQPIDEQTTTLYKTLHNQAMALVDRDTMIIPFTSTQGHKHIIKSIQPEVVYMQESLCGTEGETVSELQGWVRTTVVVIGDEGGIGGLVDTDTEDESARKGSTRGQGQKWWKREERTGVGRGVSVVEALRVGEDWRRRVGGED